MVAELIVAVVLVPFILIFIYAGIHEYRRYKSDGSANYGLVYDESTGTSYVTEISDEEDAYDPGDYDPNNYNNPTDGNDNDNNKT